MPASNIVQVFLSSVDRLQGRSCLKFKKGSSWEALSWEETLHRVEKIALGLRAIGIKKGDRVAIFSGTRMEWTLCDVAILSLGAVTVPIYQSNTSDQVAYILNNSDSRVVFVENKSLLQKIQSESKILKSLEKTILFSGRPDGQKDVLTLEELEKKGKSADREAWRKGIDSIEPTQIATLVYTSGTTGPPKGAILTHGNFVAEVAAVQEVFTLSDHHSSILFLPLAHIFARVMQFFQLATGFAQVYAESIDKLLDNIGEVRPDFFVSVPRIFEKIHERILQQVEAGSPLKKAIFSWSMAVGQEISRLRQQKKFVGPVLSLQGKMADLLVFGKLKARLGGKIRFAVSGGAPLSADISQFFHAAGILILEGYGLTETTAAINCNTLTDFRFGSVGKRVRGVEVKIAEDGEILVRGPVVFQGYFKNEEATREAFTKDGWFKTGDIGEIDRDGYLKITDRKKDIIVTAAGKNIAPQNIESVIKTVPFISQVMVHGDRRKYLTALVTLNRDSIEEYAREQAIRFADYKDLTRNPKVMSLVKKAIDEKNKSLASFESIKRFAILENDFSQETGELTPTLKVKRKFVTEKFKNVLDELYQEQ